MFKFQLFVWILLSLIISSTNGYYLTLDLAKEECYYERVEENTTIGVIFEVTDGGFLDIDFRILDPNKTVVAKSEREFSVKHTLTSQQSGVYTICFSNIYTTQYAKSLHFNVYTEAPDNKDNDKSLHGNNINPTIQQNKDMIDKLMDSVLSIKREQEYMMIREIVHLNINRSTNNRITLWAIFECILLLVITFGQIFNLKKFFEVKRVV
uniref:Suppressor/enhancer of lin-12 protein 9 (inferred by orthology to a C. elegans protein) n=1 Tax=Strongyloides venezuelensis TaxID=75913 RepID=A0A0K0FNY1_STRVS